MRMRYINFIFCLITGHIHPLEGKGNHFKDDIWNCKEGVFFFASLFIDIYNERWKSLITNERWEK